MTVEQWIDGEWKEIEKLHIQAVEEVGYLDSGDDGDN